MYEPGKRLGDRYRLVERIGAGGMGEVWRAVDDVLSREVAVKVMLAEPGFVRRFTAEARAMASVRHPNVVAIHDFHSSPDGAFLVMEYVGGEALALGPALPGGSRHGRVDGVGVPQRLVSRSGLPPARKRRDAS